MLAGEGMHSCRGACVVARGCMFARGWGRGHAWLPGACVVARRRVWLGGTCGCQGACMVARGCAWLLGGMCGCGGGGMCGIR